MLFHSKVVIVMLHLTIRLVMFLVLTDVTL
jgi:hypothetical protein